LAAVGVGTGILRGILILGYDAWDSCRESEGEKNEGDLHIIRRMDCGEMKRGRGDNTTYGHAK